MATYTFKALDLAGAATKGEMEAGDKQAVAAQLRSKGLIVVDIEELVPASAGDILDSTLVRVAEQLEKDAALRRQIKAAMIYPSLIGGFALVVLFALVAFLVPVFETIFKDFGGELPPLP